jgi:hypothetical protein
MRYLVIYVHFLPDAFIVLNTMCDFFKFVEKSIKKLDIVREGPRHLVTMGNSEGDYIF